MATYWARPAFGAHPVHEVFQIHRGSCPHVERKTSKFLTLPERKDR